MWCDRDTWWRYTDGQRDTWSHHADGKRDTWSGRADGDWLASSQPDTGWHHANWQSGVGRPGVFEAAAGLVTDLLREGHDAERLRRFLNSNCARDLVDSLVRAEAWDGIPDPFAMVEDAADNVSGSPNPTPAAYEDGTPAGFGLSCGSVSRLTASPAGTSPGGDLVDSLVRAEAWDGIPDPFAMVEDAADNVSGSPNPTPAAYEDGTPAGFGLSCGSVSRLTASPAGTSPGGDFLGGLDSCEPAPMATSTRSADPPTALGPTSREAGQAFQTYVLRCQGCQISFSSRRNADNFCCGVCRRSGGKGHSSGKSTCKREVLDTGT